MSLETSLFALLSPLVGGRLFPDVAPFDTARPYIIWQQIGGQAPTFLENTVPSKRNASVQISAWADTRAEANGTALTIEATLTQATTVQARPQAAMVAEHEPDLLRYGARQDFSIWADR